MSIEISRINKYGKFTKHQDVHLNNGDIARVAIWLNDAAIGTGRTVRLKGGNVVVRYDGEKWTEEEVPQDEDDEDITRYIAGQVA
jgi:hypothetical protein